MANDRPVSAKRPPRPAAKKAPAPPPPRQPSAAAAAAAAKKKAPPPRRRRRDMKKTIGGVIAGALVLILVVFFSFTIADSTGTPTSSPPASVGPEKIPVPAGKSLAAINTGVYPAPVDAIQCQTNEQVVYHIHSHLAIFVNGVAKQVPLGIGMNPPLNTSSNAGGNFASGATCFYWLHTHAADGIIHVESPSQQQYTLGNFFHMWGIPLAPDQVGPATGKLTVYVDGKVFPGDPNTIPLTNHGAIQLDVGTNVAPTTINWTASSL